MKAVATIPAQAKPSLARNVDRPLKVGIWCAYHVTLEQSEGIGVFAHNLARGLANLGPSVTVTMVSKPGDESLMGKTVEASGGRITVRSAQPLNRLQKAHRRLNKLLGRMSTRVQRIASRRLDSSGDSPPIAGSKPKRRFGDSCWQQLMLTATACADRAQRTMQRYEAHYDRQFDSIVDACDVWLIPYVGLPRKFAKPTVVTIHDLVCYHFPEVLDQASLAVFKNLAEEVSSRSTICACMSNFIRDNDLIGILHLPEYKVRVVQPAAPSDFGTLADPAVAAARYPVLEHKYVLYPSAFRAYKNHELLVKAMQRLRAAGHEDLHLVFTGIHAPRASLTELIKQSGVEDRVHILGKVERDVLSLLYRKALATLVSSRYEQGSFPLMEAMYWECPIACSRIPSLIELFAPMGSSMRYFDTDDVSEVTAVLCDFLEHRESILQDQQAKRSAIFGRSWTDAAADWVAVFEEAIELYADQQRGQSQQPAAA